MIHELRFKMNKYYAVNKKNNLLTYISDNLVSLKDVITLNKKTVNEFYILGDVDMKYVSRITYVDGKCVYNNKEFWISTEAAEILNSFENHVVLDFLRQSVTKYRYETELNSNASRISAIDGVAGEVDYNITVGNEFISLFREECIFTDFKTITPLDIAQKLLTVIALVQTGSFREAKMVLKTVESDAFLTTERLKKYEDMLDAADAITYATAEDYFYTAGDITEEQLEETYKRIYGMFTSEKKRTVKHILPKIAEGDKIIYLIRHSERGSDTSASGDLTENGITLAQNFAKMLVDGYETSSGNVQCEPNDAHYFSTDYARTKHTAQVIAETRGDTDYSSPTYENITLIDDLICGDKFWPDAHTDALKKYAYDPEELTSEQLESLGVSTVEEAIEKRQSDFENITQALIKLADKRLNVMITHDYFLYTYLGAAMYTDPTCTDKESVCGTVNYLDGAVIIIHPDEKTYEVYPVDCTP